MADSTNPFLVGGDSDLIEAELAGSDDGSRPTPDGNDSPQDTLSESEGVTLDHVAAKLLKDSYVLTALELHTELLEGGRDLPRLRDFFSNPANFERLKQNELSPTGLVRTSSVQTFDSLDFARYSDDGDRQESDKLAVLEFELRKAQDTIKSLRATLTKAAETELLTPESPDDRLEEAMAGDQDQIRSYEKRALNFLVSEYLLNNTYKLTSVTFAEENENQDFEDWDDVGLNTPKPPDLLRLYRDFSQHSSPDRDVRDAGCMVDILPDQTEEQEQQTTDRKELEARIRMLDDQIITLTSENEFLAHHVKAMEREAETVKLLRQKSSTPAVSPITTPQKPIAPKESANTESVTSSIQPLNEDSENSSTVEGDPTQHQNNHPESHNVPENTDHDHPTKESEPVQLHFNHIPNTTSQDIGNSLEVEVGSELRSVTFEESLLGKSDRSNTSHHQSAAQYQHRKRKRSHAFQKALLSTTFQVTNDNRIISEVSRLRDSSGEKVVLMLARCLPHIVPNVLLAKREELIPLILCTATLHPDAKERDNLLRILFNLIKRPDHEQRQMILTGCVAFGQQVGPERVESELLPQCWEQIDHKYTERRLLVAEACGTLAPYLPNEIRSSLVLSMLQQMLQDDKDEDVRQATVKSLGLLMAFVDDPDKYAQGASLLYGALQDQSDRVQSGARHVFLPAFSMWALELGRLETHLLQSLVDKLEKLFKGGESIQKASPGVTPPDKKQFCSLIQTLQQLIPVLFASVIMTGPFADKTPPSQEEIQRFSASLCFPEPSCVLFDLSVIFDGSARLAGLVCLYEEYISEEWYEPWPAYNWVTGEFIPQLLGLLSCMDVSCSEIVHQMTTLFLHICRTFGKTFTVTKVKNRFQTVLQIPEDQMDSLLSSGQTPLTKCTVPVFTAGILGAHGQEGDREELSTFLSDLLKTLSLCRAPLNSLKAAFSQLCLNADFHELLLTVLWDGVVHTSALVRTSAAIIFELLIKGVNETLISQRVIPALITLASDPETSVRIATVPAFGTIMENVTDRAMLDKVHMQFQTFMDDPMYRDQHALHTELIATFGRVGPNAEPRFRDEFVLPRLAAMAAVNSQLSSDTPRKRDVALALFDAYSALSCCFINDHLLQEAMLPGLHCLHGDLHQVAPEMADILSSMIRELEDKVNSGHITDKSVSGATIPHATTLTPGEEMKAKMLSRFKDIQSKPNFSKIFGKK